MLLWKNTKTLDGLIDDLEITNNKNEADVALLGSKVLHLNEFPNLKGIFRAGVSKNNVPVEEAKIRGIKVRFPSEKTVDYINEETANFACQLIFKMCYKNLGTIEPWVKHNRNALQNKRLLVIGIGHIGKRVVNKMKVFMKVNSWDIATNHISDLKGLLEFADFTSLHIPLTKENKNFFDKEKLSWMKDNSVLINTSRGPIVSEDDLYNEIKADRLMAAFDVYWEEPYKGKLMEFHPDKFSMTPHVASTCNEFLQGSAEELKKLIIELEEENA